jgi:hypothetical protein
MKFNSQQIKYQMIILKKNQLHRRIRLRVNKNNIILKKKRKKDFNMVLTNFLKN